MELETTLDDGTRVLFRPIRPDDKERLRRGFEQLSPQSRYRRFFRHIDHLTERDVRYLTEVDFADHAAWVAALPDEPGAPGVGVARWIRLPAEPSVAEGAVTVIDSYQHRGIGKTLLLLAARSAIERGIRAFRVWVLGDNRPALDLMRELGAIPGRWQSGVLEMTVPLPERPEDVPDSVAPLILREAGRGALVGRAHPEGRMGTGFGPTERTQISQKRPRPDLNRRPSP